MILATADTRTTREQMIPQSKQSNITSVSMSRIGLSLQPTPRLCRAVGKDFWKHQITLGSIPIRQQILGSVLTLKILRLRLLDALT
jgi:hypothetical protein